MRLAFIAIMFAASSCSLLAKARPPLPQDQRTELSVLWLARAMVSEADWTYHRDHAAIAWVLRRGWTHARRANPQATFAGHIRAYCAGLKRGIRRSDRQVKVISLHLGASKPQAWAPWEWREYRARWRKVVLYARAWMRGAVPDPCGGRADHWGGPMDVPPPSFRYVSCGPTRNIFYRVASTRK